MGTHGDHGANNADIILPSAAYTEKDAIYINTEGRLQFANKANFPPNEAREDWKIVRQISEILSLKWSIVDIEDVRSQIKMKFPHLFEIHGNSSNDYKVLLANIPKNIEFIDNSISRIIHDFYINNTISRFSKTMAECSRTRQALKKRAS